MKRMKRLTLIIATAFLMAMCGTSKSASSSATAAKPEKRPDVQYKEDFPSATQNEIDAFLKKMDATADNYSVLIFTNNFKGQKITVSNEKKRVFNDVVITNLGTKLGGSVRIDNRYDNTVYDNFDKSSTVIESKEASKYKYVYVMKNPGNKHPFTITYSNRLRPLE